MLVIFNRTNNKCALEWWRWYLRRYFKRYGGPDAVLRSVIDGLTALNVPYVLNPKVVPKYSSVLVLSGTHVLRDMIKKKKNGRIVRLVAGPNIVISPEDGGCIIMSKYIDKIVVPSEWVQEYYGLYGTTTFKKNIRVWASGIHVYTKNNTQKDIVVVYKKKCPDNVYLHVVQTLKKKNIPYVVIEYGKYTHEEYLSYLERAQFLVYLQKSESQGIAMFEAWGANVPTLHWEPGVYVSPRNDSRKIYGKIAAPYLNENLGLTFREEGDFEGVLNQFMVSLEAYQVRDHVCDTFSDETRAGALLDLIYEN